MTLRNTTYPLSGQYDYTEDYAREPSPDTVKKLYDWEHLWHQEGTESFNDVRSPQFQRRQEEKAAMGWYNRPPAETDQAAAQDGPDPVPYARDVNNLRNLDSAQKLAEGLHFASLEDRREFADLAATEFLAATLHPPNPLSRRRASGGGNYANNPEEADRSDQILALREVIAELFNHHDHKGEYGLGRESPREQEQARGYLAIAEALTTLNHYGQGERYPEFDNPERRAKLAGLLAQAQERQAAGLDYGAEERREFAPDQFAKDFLVNHPHNALVGGGEHKPEQADWQELKAAFQEETFYSAANYREAAQELAAAFMTAHYAAAEPPKPSQENAIAYLEQNLIRYLTAPAADEKAEAETYANLAAAKALAELWPEEPFADLHEQYDFLQSIGEESPELTAHALLLLQAERYSSDLEKLGLTPADGMRLEQNGPEERRIRLNYPTGAEGIRYYEEDSLRRYHPDAVRDLEKALQRRYAPAAAALAAGDSENFAAEMASSRY